MVDPWQERLRLYARDSGLHRSYLPVIAKIIAKLDATQPTHTVRLSPTTYEAVRASSIVARAQAVLGPDNAKLDESSSTLLIKCPPRTAQLFQRELSSPYPFIERIEAHFLCHICCKSTDGIMLSFCEHVICFACFDRRIWHVLADPLGKHFPIRCDRDGCGDQIALSDIRKLASIGRLQTLLASSVSEHARMFPDKYRSCRTRGCNSIYLVSETASIFTCPTCLAQTCTFKDCGKEPHVGWDCRLNKVTFQSFGVEKTFVPLLTTTKFFDVIMECSGCDAVLMNTNRRKHHRCSSCQTHACWECKGGFTSLEAYVDHQYLAGCKPNPNHGSE